MRSDHVSESQAMALRHEELAAILACGDGARDWLLPKEVTQTEETWNQVFSGQAILSGETGNQPSRDRGNPFGWLRLMPLLDEATKQQNNKNATERLGSVRPTGASHKYGPPCWTLPLCANQHGRLNLNLHGTTGLVVYVTGNTRVVGTRTCFWGPPVRSQRFASLTTWENLRVDPLDQLLKHPDLVRFISAWQ